jgi:phosphoribosylglycinamide formyltransferase-1
MKKIAILASGNGTNAQQISEYLAGNSDIEVACIVYNRRDAYVAERAKNLGIEAHYFNRADFMESDRVLDYLKAKGVDYLILAGFLLLVPQNLLEAFPQKIINIHPALLPNYGGKGMYGHHVHEAVVANHEPESGITIHVVDSHYDHGKTLFQAKCRLTPSDTPDSLAAKIHILEKTYFPPVVEAFVLGKPMPEPKILES